MDTKFADVIDNDEIGPVAGRDRTPSEQTVMSRRDQRRLAHGRRRRHAAGDNAAQQAVDVPVALAGHRERCRRSPGTSNRPAPRRPGAAAKHPGSERPTLLAPAPASPAPPWPELPPPSPIHDRSEYPCRRRLAGAGQAAPVHGHRAPGLVAGWLPAWPASPGRRRGPRERPSLPPAPARAADPAVRPPRRPNRAPACSQRVAGTQDDAMRNRSNGSPALACNSMSMPANPSTLPISWESEIVAVVPCGTAGEPARPAAARCSPGACASRSTRE